MQCLFFAQGYCKYGSACRFRHGFPDDAREQRHFQRPSSSSTSPLSGTAAAPFVPSPVKRHNLMLQQQQQEILRRIFMTFPADSTFTEEDVSSYFSGYGPVQDVRIPFQRERVYGFVTFVHPETVKLILGMRVPHTICDSRVVVKACREKGQILKRNPQLLKYDDDTSEDSEEEEDDDDDDDEDDDGNDDDNDEGPSLDHDSSSSQVHNSTLVRQGSQSCLITHDTKNQEERILLHGSSDVNSDASNDNDVEGATKSQSVTSQQESASLEHDTSASQVQISSISSSTLMAEKEAVDTEKEEPAVGIDLGTTYSCVGVWKKNQVEIIANEQSHRVTPSMVAFDDVERHIGEAAFNQAVRNHKNTIFDVKRLIGRRYNDESVQKDKEHWPFKIIAGDAGRPSIVVDYLEEQKHFSAEEISSMILFKMKEMASNFLGCTVTKAVVTVPAYFNNSQRQATKDAGAIVGLDIMQVLNEPTAAALEYSFHNKDSCGGGKRRILVFDLGGGTFDVSLFDLAGDGSVEVKATSGDTHLRGQDFDTRVVDHALKVLRQKHGHDLSGNKKCLAKLRIACEKAKRTLSIHNVANIELDTFYQGEDFCFKLSRAKFEELNQDLFDKCMAHLKKCLEDAKVDKGSIDEVVLVGGSTRIPRVQEMLREFFEVKKLYKAIDPDEAVAFGATIKAKNILNGEKKDPQAPKLKLLDVTPLSLGINTRSQIMSVIIPKNTRIPCTEEKVYLTTCDNQEDMVFEILEGESTKSAENHVIGEFRVCGIRPAPAGEIEFTCTFHVDASGILTVTARNEDDHTEEGMTVTRDRFALGKEDIDRMSRDAKTYELQDKENLEREEEC